MPTPGLPVTVVISRTPMPGKEAELVAWAEGITEVAHGFPGHLGGKVYAPGEVDSGNLVLAFSFDDAEHLSAWEHSPERQEWLRKIDGLVKGEATAHSVSGFEGIFSHSPGKPMMPPPRWKTAAIIAIALYPMSLLISWLLVPHLMGLNVVVRVLITTAIIVPYMAWVGVPYLSRWLRSWLHP